MNKLLVAISILFSLTCAQKLHAQNNSYVILYDQIYPMLNDDNYIGAKNLFDELRISSLVDPSERLIFSYEALANGDVDYFKSENEDLIRNYGYFFRYEDTLSVSLNQDLRSQYNLVDWLVAETNENYPLWIKDHPEAFFIQQKLIGMKAAAKTAQYYKNLIDYHDERNDSLASAEVLKYLRDIHFTQLYEIVKISRTNGLPNNFDHGYDTYYTIQIILMQNLFDEFNLERTWHHIFPFLEKAYLDGKISNTFIKLYDQALRRHYDYQYYGTIDGLEVLDPDGLAERRKKFGLY